jgi:hypothetical protein
MRALSRPHNKGNKTEQWNLLILHELGVADTWQCSTERPQCLECRQRNTPCKYLPLPSDRRVTSKRKHEDVQQHSSGGLERVLALMRAQPVGIVNEIFTQVRRGSDVVTILRYIEYGSLRLQLMLIPNTTFQFTSPYLADMMPLFGGSDNPYLGSRL